MNVDPSTPRPLQVPPAGVALNWMIVSVKQTLVGALVITILFTPANTVIVKVLGVPVQPLAVGVTVIVATIVEPVALVTTNWLILPVPLAPRPIAVLLLVQLKVVPVVAPENVIAVVVPPSQSAWLATAFTVGVGFTVIVKLVVVPAHPAAVVGVTVIVPLIAAAVVLVAVKAGMFPCPLATSPMAVFELVQLKIVPATVPENVIAVVVAPLQSVWFVTAFTVAFGFTVIVKLVVAPVQPLAVGVTVIVPLIAVIPALVAVKAAMFPVPLAARPIAVFEFVQLKVVLATNPVNVIAAVDCPLQTV